MLLQLSTNQRERLPDETVEQREARLQHVGERSARASGEEPFKERSVHLKMKSFHEYFTSLSSPKCSNLYISCATHYVPSQATSQTVYKLWPCDRVTVS